MLRRTSVLGTALAALAFASSARADADVSFESPALANCTTVVSQYAGLHFVTAAPEPIGQIALPSVISAGAHSPTHALAAGQCGDEFPYPQVAFQLAQTRSAVSLWARAPSSGFPLSVQLRAYDTGGTRIDTNGTTHVTLPDTGVWTQLSAAAADGTNRIATVALDTADDNTHQGYPLQLDDIHLTDAADPVTPDFTIGPAPTAVVAQGQVAEAVVPINGVNGSAGAVRAALSDLPPDVTVLSVTQSGASIRVVVRVGLGTPDGARSMTLTATPNDAATGPAARSTQVGLVVQPTRPTITINEPADGTLLERVPYDPVARGTFSSPRGGGQLCVVVTRTVDVPAIPASCTVPVSGTSASWFQGLTGLAPGANYLHAFIRDSGGYVGTAVRLLRIADETTGLDLRVTGVQISQGVQSSTVIVPTGATEVPYTGVQLVQGKPVFVRIFADTNRPARSDGRTPGVAARLRVFARGTETGVSPLNPIPVARELAVGGLYPTAAELADFSAGYRQDLGAALTTQGPVTIEAAVNDGFTPIIECATCHANNRLRITGLRFRPMRTRAIYPLAFTDTAGGTRRSLSQTPAELFALTRRIAPFPVDVHPFVATVDITAPLQEAARYIADGHPDARSENWVTHFPGDYERDHNPDGPAIGVGAAGSYPGGMETSALFCCAPPRIDPFAVVLQNRPLTSIAHEFGHTEGLAHADHTCGGNADGQVSDDGWPDRSGTVLGTGLDWVGRRALPAYDPATRAPASFDFMSYCANEGNAWIATRNWDILVDHEATGGASRGAQLRQAPQGPAGPALAVSAVLPSAGGPGVITDVQPVDGGAQGADPVGGLTLSVLGANGAPTSGTAVRATPVHTDTPGAVPQLQVSAVVPAGSAPRAIAIARGAITLAQRAASATAPTVRLLAPRRGARIGGALTLRWSGSDRDGDKLTFAVDEATGPRAPFKVVAAGLTGTRATIPLASLAPSPNARLRIRALDGFRRGTAQVTGLRIAPAPPTVTILEPTKTLRVRADAVVAAEGQAYEARSRALRGRALTWRLDGRVIGRGGSVMVADLPPGRHALSLTAVAGGARTTAIRTVTVTKVTPLLLTAAAPPKTARSARFVTLQLATSVPSRVRITGGAKPITVPTGRRTRRARVALRASTTTLRLRISGGGGTASAALAVPRG